MFGLDRGTNEHLVNLLQVLDCQPGGVCYDGYRRTQRLLGINELNLSKKS